MSEKTITQIPHHNPYAAGEPQASLNTLGMWVFLATEVMFFGGLFTGYMVLRLLYADTFAEASQHLDFIAGTVNTFILLTSSFSMALSVRAAKLGKNFAIFFFLLITIMLGTAFLGIKFYEYYLKFQEGLIPTASFVYEGENPGQARLFFSLYFIMTGLHAIHMIIGIFILSIAALMAFFKRFSETRYAPIETIGLYWHFVDLVWIFLFPILYLIERN